MMKRALGEDRTSQASPVLRELLRGHMLSLWFCAGHQATRMLELAVRAGVQVWSHVRVPGSWQARVRVPGSLQARVRAFLADLDWQEVGPWQWFHAGQQTTLDWSQPEQRLEAHWLRESWRRAKYHSWSRSDRIDVQFAGHVPYCERRCTCARDRYERATNSIRTVLAGGSVSEAHYAAMQGLPVPGVCSWCAHARVPSWLHLAWECPAHAVGRPPEPACLLAQRLGRPQGRGCNVVDRLARVRIRLLRRAGYAAMPSEHSFVNASLRFDVGLNNLIRFGALRPFWLCSRF